MPVLPLVGSRMIVSGLLLGPDWHARKPDTDRRTRSFMNQLRALHPDGDITITPAA